MLSESDRARVRALLSTMVNPVRLAFFTQTLGCDTCPQTRRLLDEIVALADKVSLDEHNIVLDKEKAAEYGVDRVPAIVLLGEQDSGIRFYGTPAGYEFMSLIDAILLVSTGDSGLSEDSRALVAAVDRSLDIKVFVTPTCPHCPRAVSLAQRMALDSPRITTAIVEVAEFPDLIRRYQITGVPKTVVNDQVEILGAQPEAIFVRQVIQAGTGVTPES